MQLPQVPPLPFRDLWVLRALQGLLVLKGIKANMALEGNMVLLVLKAIRVLRVR
jgi:hypothetical protein